MYRLPVFACGLPWNSSNLWGMEPTQPRILDHTNYRSFLKAHYEFMKQNSRNFSYEAWARKLGLRNNTSLLKIIRGDRNAGPEVQEKLIQYFHFHSDEISYFRDLVLLEKIPEQSPLRHEIIERLTFRHKDGEFHHMNADQFALLSQWWSWALRQLIKFKRFKRDSSQEIAKLFRFKVTPKEIEVSVDRLIEFGFVQVDQEGVLVTDPTPQHIRSDVSNEAIRSFHENSLINAQIALRNQAVEEREFNALVLAVKEEDLGAAKEEIVSFMRKFNQRFAKEADGDTVYQLELAWFPLTKKCQKEGVK